MVAIQNENILTKLGSLKKLPKRPMVSVVIAAYNEEKYISHAIESLLKQTYKPIELIVANDASTDKTLEIVKKYKNKGVKLFNNEKRGGPGSAYNLGWRNSKGQILMFFDSDHIYGENYIADLLTPILKEEDVCTMHNMEKIANFSNLWARAFGKRITTKNGRGEIFTLIRREVFEKFGPFDPNLGYADDKTLFFNHGLTSFGVDTEISHFNPDTFNAHWGHGKWVGRSNPRPFRTITIFPIFPLYVAYKSVNQFVKDPYPPFIYFLPFYNTIKYFAYFVGAIQRIGGFKN